VTWRRSGPWLLLALLAASPLAAWLVGGQVYLGNGTDLYSYQIPLRQWAASALLRGEWPAWNPYELGGVPAHAAMQLGLAYPPHLLGLALPAAHATTWLMALHLGWLALGVAWLVGVWLRLPSTSARWPSQTQVLSGALGLAVAGSGATWGHVFAGHVGLVEAWAWLPWIWSLTLSGVRNRELTRLALAAGAWGLQLLAGHPQTSYLTGFALVPLLLNEVMWPDATAGQDLERSGVPESKRWPGSVVALAALAGTTLGGVLLAAVQLLPSGAVAGEMHRQLASPSEIALAFSAPAHSLWTAVAPMTWGGTDGKLVEFAYHEAQAFVGGPLLGLALLGVAVGGRRAWLLGFTCAVCVWLSLGSEGRLLPALLDLVPGIGSFRVPGRWLLPATVTLTMLAAHGLAGLVRAPMAKARPLADRLAAALLALTALGLWWAAADVALERGWWHDVVAAKPQASARWTDAANATRGQLQWAAAWLALTAAATVWPSWRRWTAWLLGLGLAGTALWHAGLHTGPSSARPAAEVAWSTEVGARLREAVGDQHRLATAASLRQANRGGTAGVRVAGAYEPAVDVASARYGNLLAGRAADGFAVNFQVRKPSAWLDRLAVSHLLAPAADTSAAAAFRGWQRVAEFEGGLALWQHPAPRPRIEVPAEVQVEPDPRAAVQRLADLPRERVLVSRALTHAMGARATWQVLVDRDDRLELEVATDRPVVLVVRDALAAGWQASLDDTAATTALCDGLFRAVAVPAGRHRLVWQHTVPGLAAGVGLSLLTWCGLAAWLWRRWRAVQA
jgi:hypothetical protein